MRYLLTVIFISITCFAHAQTKENINQAILAEYFSTEVLKQDIITTEGKSLPYFFVLEFGPNGGAVAIDVLTTKIDYGKKYPIVAKITFYRNTREFPDDISMDIDFGYLKNDSLLFPWRLSSTGIRHQKLIKFDTESDNAYFEYGSQKNYNELFSYKNLQNNIYKLIFFRNQDPEFDYLKTIYTFKKIEKTIENGKRISVKKKVLEIF